MKRILYLLRILRTEIPLWWRESKNPRISTFIGHFSSPYYEDVKEVAYWFARFAKTTIELREEKNKTKN